MLSLPSVNRRSHRVLDGAKGEDERDVLPVVAAAIELGGDINADSQVETALHSLQRGTTARSSPPTRLR